MNNSCCCVDKKWKHTAVLKTELSTFDMEINAVT